MENTPDYVASQKRDPRNPPTADEKEAEIEAKRAGDQPQEGAASS